MREVLAVSGSRGITGPGDYRRNGWADVVGNERERQESLVQIGRRLGCSGHTAAVLTARAQRRLRAAIG